MRVCPEACSLFWAALSLACFWYSRCRLEQAWHRVSSGMGGAPHSIQMPRSLALSLLSWVLRRINSDTRGRSKKYPTELYKLWKELDGKEEYPLEDLVEHCTVADAMEVPENEPGQF